MIDTADHACARPTASRDSAGATRDV